MSGYDFDQVPEGFDELPDWLQDEARTRQLDRAAKDQTFESLMRRELGYAFLGGFLAGLFVVGGWLGVFAGIATGWGAARGVFKEWNALRFSLLFVGTLTLPYAVQLASRESKMGMHTPFLLLIPPVVGVVLGMALGRDKVK